MATWQNLAELLEALTEDGIWRNCGDLWHLYEGPSLGSPSSVDGPLVARRQATRNQTVGIQRFRRSTKTPSAIDLLVTDHLGRRVAAHLFPDDRAEIQSADVLVAKALASSRLRTFPAVAATLQEHRTCLPAARTGSPTSRNGAEGTTYRLKDFRRLTTCCDKLVWTFRDTVALDEIHMLWPQCSLERGTAVAQAIAPRATVRYQHPWRT